jgi:pyruvate formate lyase activating enzyme
MQIGGLTPLTSIDFPNCLAAVIFCQGCPWGCGYCHNHHLIPRRGENQLDWSAVIRFLRRRQGLLDAVVFSGGEPTLQDNLKSAVSEVRGLGFKVGLHTSGIYPSRLGELLPLLSWVGMDIKAVFSDYDKVTGAPKSGEKARESARLLLASGASSEFRTTVHPLYHTQDSLLQLAEELQQLGVKHYLMQEFRSHGCANEIFNNYSARELLDDAICSRIGTMFDSFSVRRA